MSQRNITLEWHIGEENSPWTQRVSSTLEEVSNALTAEQQLVIILLRNVAIGLVAFTLVAGAAQPHWEREQVRVGDGIHAALMLEEQAHRTDNRTALGNLIDKEAAGRWQSVWKSVSNGERQIDRPDDGTGSGRDASDGQSTDSDSTVAEETSVELLNLQQADDLIMAEVVVHRRAYGWTGFNPYRETRFYRETSDGWIRTLPEQNFWGELQVMESANLRFEFYDRDAGFVQNNIPHWEQLYLSLHEMLGLEFFATESKLTFVIVPEPVRGRGGYGEYFEITSPLLTQAPVYLSPQAYLHQSVVNRLTYQVSDATVFESSNNQQYEDTTIGRWRTVRRGLRSWLRSQLLDPAWPWDQQSDALFIAYLPEQLPLSLADLTGIDMAVSSEREAILWQTAASASFFAYVTTAYETDIHGVPLLPALVTGFKQHRTWEALLQDKFGQTVAEFEEGWNQWLAQKI